VPPVTLPRLLRATSLALLVLVLIVGVPSAPGEGKPSTPLPVSLTELDESTDSTWLRLLRHGAEAPVHAILPGDPPGAPPPVTTTFPQRLRADRAAGLGVEAHQEVQLTLTTPAGLSQELSLAPDDGGAFLLRPRQPGPARWELAVADGRTEALAGWVESPRPLRILALSGPPSSESRLALRALEEAGEEVEAWIHLGRDLWVGRDPGPLPQDAQAYEELDVVILFPGLQLPEPVVQILGRTVEEEGLGFLLAGSPSPSAQGGIQPAELLQLPSLATGVGPTTSATAESLSWTLPPEISPLPPADIEVRIQADQASPMLLATPGRGRIGILSIADTWRWRMEAEEAEGHRRFWQSTVAWLAGGLVHDPILEVAGDRVRVGEDVRVRILGQSEEDVPTHLVITPPGGPDARWEMDLPASTPEGSIRLQETRFVPFEPGQYLLEARKEGDEALVRSSLLVLDREESELDAGGRLARLALASPGGGIWGEDPSAPTAAARLLPWPFLLFGALALLLTGEWLIRRLGGRP